MGHEVTESPRDEQPNAHRERLTDGTFLSAAYQLTPPMAWGQPLWSAFAPCEICCRQYANQLPITTSFYAVWLCEKTQPTFDSPGEQV